jgi:hypothetical protein
VAEELLHLMVDRKQREIGIGKSITFKVTPSMTYFL